MRPSPVYGGEILGIAGISGSGQKELLEAIAGLQHAESGASIEYYAARRQRTTVQLVGKSPQGHPRGWASHLSFVPEDRLGMGLVGSMGMTDNMMLQSYGKGHSPFVRPQGPAGAGRDTSRRSWSVVTPDLNTPVAPPVRRQRAEGAGGPRDRRRPHRADDRLRRARPGHQHVLHDLPPAQRAEKAAVWRSFTSARIWTCCWSCVTASWCSAAARSTAFVDGRNDHEGRGRSA